MLIKSGLQKGKGVACRCGIPVLDLIMPLGLIISHSLGNDPMLKTVKKKITFNTNCAEIEKCTLYSRKILVHKIVTFSFFSV